MKILIVDDDPNIRSFFSQTAKARGYTEVDVVSSGEEALAQIVRMSYDLIVLDIAMPGISGLEILALLRNMCPHAIIAIASGHLPDDLPAESAVCADVLLDKPVDLTLFCRLLDCVAQIWESMEEIRQMGRVPLLDN